MTLAEFIAKVESEDIRINVGGRNEDGQLVSGFADASKLTNRQIAAEAFSHEVDEAANLTFDQIVVEVAKVKGSVGTSMEVADAV